MAVSVFYFTFYFYRIYTLGKDNLEQSGFLLTESLGHASEFSLYSQDPTFLLSTIRGIAESEEVLFAAVYTKTGATLFKQQKNEISEEISPQMLERILGGEWLKLEGKDSVGKNYYDFLVPVIPTSVLEDNPNKEIIGIARIVVSLKQIEKARDFLLFWTSIMSIIALAIIIFLARFLAKSITKPIDLLVKGAHKIGQGNLGYKIEIKASDELEKLALAFNEMADNLQSSRRTIEEAKDTLEVKVNARTRELHELNETLEEKVVERTKELRNRLSELEKFHRLTVGRELKMIELKSLLKKVNSGVTSKGGVPLSRKKGVKKQRINKSGK